MEDRDGFRALLDYSLGHGAKIILYESASRFAGDTVVQELEPSKGDFRWTSGFSTKRVVKPEVTSGLGMAMNTILHYEQFSVVNRIKELGLELSDLLETVRAAYAARSACTDLDPPYFAGSTMHAVAVRHLRIQLMPKGWSKTDEGNYSRVISPNGDIAIGIATGDELTGMSAESPSTRSPKGRRTFEVLAANAQQLGFDFQFPEGFEPPNQLSTEQATWLLLIHSRGGVVQSELSHPLGIDDSRRVSGWRERIVLPNMDFDPNETIDFEHDEGVDFDIPVVRRG